MSNAKYCVQCGWPVQQECPYECGTIIPLLDLSGRSTPICPSCAKPFLLCTRCGRLHGTRESHCLTIGCGLPLTSAFDVWPLENGSPSGSTWVKGGNEFEGSVVASPAHNPGPILGPVCSGGSVFFVVGSTLRRWRPGDGEMPVPDLPAPDIDGPLSATGSAIYFVGGGGLHRFDLQNLDRTTFQGVVLAQVVTSSQWVGVQIVNNIPRFRGIADEILFDRPAFESAAGVPRMFAHADKVYALSSEGRLELIERDRTSTLVQLESAPHLMAWFHANSFYCWGIDRIIRRYDLSTFSLLRTWQLESDPTCPPILNKDTGFAFQRNGQYQEFYLDGGLGRVRNHSFGSISSAIGVTVHDRSAAIVVGRTTQGRQVASFYLDTGQLKRNMHLAGDGDSIKVALADGLVYIACSGVAPCRIRSYPL